MKDYRQLHLLRWLALVLADGAFHLPCDRREGRGRGSHSTSLGRPDMQIYAVRFLAWLCAVLASVAWYGSEAVAQPVAWPFKGASAGVPTWALTETAPSNTDIEAAIARMRASGVTWFQIGVSWSMAAPSATVIQPMTAGNGLHWVMPTISDQRLEQIIALFRQRGMKVFLRPGVEVADGSWRGAIAPGDWSAWFASYTAFLSHYAALAQRTGVEMLSVGYELNSSVDRTSAWKALIGTVRTLYAGSISYDTGGVLYHGSRYDTASFDTQWEAASAGDFLTDVDLIGVDWYPQIASTSSSGADEMTTNVGRIADRFLEPLHARFQKPIFFAEIDYPSVDGAAMNPLANRSGVPDPGEQATAFEAVLRVFSSRRWFVGMFPAGMYLNVVKDNLGTTNSVWFKQAELVLQRWYGAGALAKADCVLEWAQRSYPALLWPAAGTEFLAPYYYRHFAGTGTYVGISTSDQRVGLLGPSTAGSVVDLGEFSNYVSLSGCAATAQ